MGIDTRDITKICPACFNDLDGNGTCPFCRKREEDLKNPPSALPVRTMLNGRYLVGTRLGMGGFGITYVGRDMGRSRKVVIKEFFPDTDVNLLATAIQSYKDIDAWNETPILKEESFNKLQEVMTEAGELTQKAPYSKIINNKYAEEAMK